MLLNESWRCKWNHLHFQMVTIDPVVFAAGANGTPIVFFFFRLGMSPLQTARFYSAQPSFEANSGYTDITKCNRFYVKCNRHT